MFVIETPSLDRLYVLQRVLGGKGSTKELTESELLFLENLTMTATINSRAETNAMVFSEVEDAMMN